MLSSAITGFTAAGIYGLPKNQELADRFEIGP